MDSGRWQRGLILVLSLTLSRTLIMLRTSMRGKLLLSECLWNMTGKAPSATPTEKGILRLIT
ncbi:hypothetical protein LINPERHAP1_LOCUS19136 [Linum perenne]